MQPNSRDGIKESRGRVVIEKVVEGGSGDGRRRRKEGEKGGERCLL
jgi:hypothetical protein